MSWISVKECPPSWQVRLLAGLLFVAGMLLAAGADSLGTWIK